MRVAVICCANGLGHTKRCVRVLRKLAQHTPTLEISLFGDPAIWERLQTWSDLRSLHKLVAPKITAAQLPLRWFVDERQYGKWMLEWYSAMASWRLDDFDQVISDNLVEPLAFTRRVTLMGSFFWHDILAQAYPTNPTIARYRSFAQQLLSSTRPTVIANRYFAMPTVAEQANVRFVGLIPFVREAAVNPRRAPPRRMLVALGNAPVPPRTERQLAAAVEVLGRAGVQIKADRDWADRWGTGVAGYAGDKFGLSGFAWADFAIVRGGLGTIADCVAAKVPMVYIGDSNPELRFNREVISQLGIGCSLTELLDDAESVLSGRGACNAAGLRMEHLNVSGEGEAATVMARMWGM